MKLKRDIQATFQGQVGIQALFISEFGNMYQNIDAGIAKDVFEELLRDIDLSYLVIKALPPYVAIVDPTYREVLACIKWENLCTEERNFAMKVFSKHTESGARLGVANCHIPSPTGTSKRKKRHNRYTLHPTGDVGQLAKLDHRRRLQP